MKQQTRFSKPSRKRSATWPNLTAWQITLSYGPGSSWVIDDGHPTPEGLGLGVDQDLPAGLGVGGAETQRVGGPLAGGGMRLESNSSGSYANVSLGTLSAVQYS